MPTKTLIAASVLLAIALYHVRTTTNALEEQVKPLQHRYTALLWQASALEHANAELQRPSKARRQGIVTAYSCNGIENEAQRLLNCPNGITALGIKPRVGSTVACSKELLGKTVQITLRNGKTLIRHCSDTGGAITNHRFDIYMDTIATALSFGKQSATYTVLD